MEDLSTTNSDIELKCIISESPKKEFTACLDINSTVHDVYDLIQTYLDGEDSICFYDLIIKDVRIIHGHQDHNELVIGLDKIKYVYKKTLLLEKICECNSGKLSISITLKKIYDDEFVKYFDRYVEENLTKESFSQITKHIDGFKFRKFINIFCENLKYDAREITHLPFKYRNYDKYIFSNLIYYFDVCRYLDPEYLNNINFMKMVISKLYKLENIFNWGKNYYSISTEFSNTELLNKLLNNEEFISYACVIYDSNKKFIKN